jgi:hypothetical protein
MSGNPDHGQVPFLGDVLALFRTADGSTDGEVGIADGARVGTAGLVGVPGLSVRVPPVGRGLTGPGDADGVGAAGGLLAGGGARGTVGDAGAGGVVRWSGSAMRAAMAHDTPTPAAARSSRRRAAAWRMAS